MRGDIAAGAASGRMINDTREGERRLSDQEGSRRALASVIYRRSVQESFMTAVYQAFLSPVPWQVSISVVNALSFLERNGEDPFRRLQGSPGHPA